MQVKRERIDGESVRAFGSDAVAAFILFGAVVLLFTAVGWWLLNEWVSLKVIIVLAMAFGLLAAVPFAHYLGKKETTRKFDIEKSKREIKEIERQKQIDAMRRENSNIPDVKREE